MTPLITAPWNIFPLSPAQLKASDHRPVLLERCLLASLTPLCRFPPVFQRVQVVPQRVQVDVDQARRAVRAV